MFGEEQGLGAVRPNIILAVARPAMIPLGRSCAGDLAEIVRFFVVKCGVNAGFQAGF